MRGTRSVVIHGHFYQPPREDPWLETVPPQAGAAPWHDWNVRIERECYRAVAAARVLDGDGRIARVVNTLAWMSFNAGPTLLEWMEAAAPATYAAFLAADRAAVARLGHGGAIAQPYHHVILPLCSRRDKVTEVRWGIADFRRRFGREPEGMWCPETAVDDETLEVLAREGIRFTVVAPSQVEALPPHGRPGLVRTAGGREIALAIYDGALSHGVAFGRLLANARVWRSELLRGLEDQAGDAVAAIACDGETFGHHHHFAEMALAWLLDDLSRTPRVAVTNFAALLGRHPAHDVVRLVAPSSWSCSHGVERWRADCGCRAAAEHPPRQWWRAPLRAALDELRTGLDTVYAREGRRLFLDPWAARDAYGAAVAADAATREAVVRRLLRPGLSARQQVRAHELLELARDGLRMFTSCAWFFDDITGLEVAQALRYAARAIDLAGAAGVPLEGALLAALRGVRGAEPASGTAEEVWVRDVRPPVPPLVRMAAGVGAQAACIPGWTPSSTPAFTVAVEGERVLLTHRRTGRSRHFDVRVARRGVADLQVYVVPRPDLEDGLDDGELPMGGTIPVALAELPEEARDAVRDAIRQPRRRALATRLLSAETLARVAVGEASLVDESVAALQATVEGVAADPSADRVERALALVDLLELLGHHVPFDAQTAFTVALGAAPSSARATLRPLAARLGFAASVLEEGAVPAGVAG